MNSPRSTISSGSSTTSSNGNLSPFNSMIQFEDEEMKKKKIRQMQNRQSAAQYRERKKEYLEKLESIVDGLENDRNQLLQQTKQLNQKQSENTFKISVLEEQIEAAIRENKELKSRISLLTKQLGSSSMSVDENDDQINQNLSPQQQHHHFIPSQQQQQHSHSNASSATSGNVGFDYSKPKRDVNGSSFKIGDNRSILNPSSTDKTNHHTANGINHSVGSNHNTSISSLSSGSLNNNGSITSSINSSINSSITNSQDKSNSGIILNGSGGENGSIGHISNLMSSDHSLSSSPFSLYNAPQSPSALRAQQQKRQRDVSLIPPDQIINQPSVPPILSPMVPTSLLQQAQQQQPPFSPTNTSPSSSPLISSLSSSPNSSNNFDSINNNSSNPNNNNNNSNVMFYQSTNSSSNSNGNGDQHYSLSSLISPSRRNYKFHHPK
eukprot:gene10222-12536_t